METKFQTSFIPKKPLVTQETIHAPSSTSILMLIAVLLFIVSIGAAGFAYFAKGYLQNSQQELSAALADNEKRFNLPLIEELKKANTKITLANQLLKNHVAVSEALNIIGGLTAERVRFSDFEFTAPDAVRTAERGAPSSVYRIRMKGMADSYNSIAFQSDVFSKSERYGTNKVLRNPILSDMSLDQTGNVTFNFTAEIVLPDISYEKVLREDLQAEGILPQ